MNDQSSDRNFVLFAQHGWADSSRDIAYLARSLTSTNPIYAPDLGLLDTWINIEPLINKVEKLALGAIAAHPDLPWRIVGHSMGGLIWLEILDRRPEWRSKVHSLVLIGSPVGGSDLGRLFDPLRWFPLIAKDLGKNRRPIAETIAAQIPTISIIGDLGDRTDGTVPVGCSEFVHAHLTYLDGITHAKLKNHPRVAAAIRQFWAAPTITPCPDDFASQLISKLRSLDLTEVSSKNFGRAKVVKTYANGIKLWRWTSPWQVQHLYVSQFIHQSDRCVYSAYTGWIDKNKLAIVKSFNI